MNVAGFAGFCGVCCHLRVENGSAIYGIWVETNPANPRKPRSMTSPASSLRQLARAVGRLRPDWQNPERYFADRSEIEHAMRRLANQIERRRW